MIKKSLIVRIILGTIIGCTFCVLLLNQLFSFSGYRKNLLDSQLSVKIKRASGGSVEKYDTNHFFMVNRGDIVKIKVPLEKKYQKKKNQALCFHIYHAAFSVFCQKKELYRYGQKQLKQGKMLGAIYTSVTIPESAKSLTVVCRVAEDNAFNSLSGFTIMPANESSMFTLLGGMPEFFLFSLILLLGFLLSIGLLFSDLRKHNMRMSFFLSLFCASLACYVLTFHGMLNVISINPWINANLEYISLFFMPVPFMGFFFEFEENRGKRKILYGILFVVCIGLFIGATILNYTSSQYHYCYFLLPLHGFIIFILLLLMVLGFVGISKRSMSYRMIQMGISILMLIFGLDIVRFHVDRILNVSTPWSKVMLTPFAGVLLIAALSFVCYLRIHDAGEDAKEVKQLEEIAYIDKLTGLMNRHQFEKTVDEIERQHIQDFVVIFMDVNNLKYVNDKYGHDMGDRYILQVSGAIRRHFKGMELCGRTGGDEFVIISERMSRRRVMVCLEGFQRSIDEINEKKFFPYFASVACGVASSYPGKEMGIRAALKKADEAMYEDKKAIKAKYGLPNR